MELKGSLRLQESTSASKMRIKVVVPKSQMLPQSAIRASPPKYGEIEAELSTVSQLSSSNWEQPHCPSALWEQASLASDEAQEEEAKLQRIWQQSGWVPAMLGSASSPTNCIVIGWIRTNNRRFL